MRNLYELFQQYNEKNAGKNGNEDDAMFTKRPLGGNSCASCAKDIINLSGTMADFNAWKKLPFREPNERLSKYGPGFSKIL